MDINSDLDIKWEKILIVWNWSYKNLWDELILLWTVKLLQKQWKKIYISAYDTERLSNFFSQFISIENITFVTELPKWFRSFFRFFFTKRIKDLFKYFSVDSIVLWWWEIMTEENRWTYLYWFLSILPCWLKWSKIYLMWWIQTPSKKINKYIFNLILKKTLFAYVRDNQCLKDLKKYRFKNSDFFMDTSYWSVDFSKITAVKKYDRYIIININSKWKQYLDNITNDVYNYLHDWYKVLYVPVSKWKTDLDINYFYQIQKKIWKNTNFEILDREENYMQFLQILKGADKVISVRLHLFLISEFLDVNTEVYPYQKKIIKMKNVIQNLKKQN